MSEPTLEGERTAPSAQELMKSIENLEQTIAEVRALLQSVLVQSRDVVAAARANRAPRAASPGAPRRRLAKPRSRRRRDGDA